MGRSFTKTFHYDAAPEAVWHALTNPERMNLWLMNFDQTPGEVKLQFTPKAGTSFRLDAPAKGWRGFVVGHVEDVVPKKRLVLTWAHSAYQDRNPARIELSLEPNGTGTTLHLRQSNFPGFKGFFVMLGAKLGWSKMLGSGLRAVLEQAD